MTTSLMIRPGMKEDLPEMLRLWQEMMELHATVDPRFHPRRWPEARDAWATHVREHVWDSDQWCVFVAERNGRLVGQILGMVRKPVPVFEPCTYGYVTDIVVDSTNRRCGIGRKLFAALRDWMREQGATHLELQVLSKNVVSQAFWRAMGCTDYSDTMWYSFDRE